MKLKIFIEQYVRDIWDTRWLHVFPIKNQHSHAKSKLAETSDKGKIKVKRKIDYKLSIVNLNKGKGTRELQL